MLGRMDLPPALLCATECHGPGRRGKETGSSRAQLTPCSDLCPLKIKVHCGLRIGPEDGL